MQKRMALTGVGVAAAMVLAGGCGNAADKVAEKAAEEATGGDLDLDAGDGTFSFDDGEVSFETDAEGNMVLEGPDGEVYTADADGKVTVSGDDGDTTFATGENAELPAGWPEFLALPEGASILTSQTNTADAVVTGTVTAEVEGTVGDLYQGFKDALEAAGLELGSDSLGAVDDFASLSGEKDDQAVHVTIGPGADDKAYITLAVTGL